jgi:ubiquinone/menaquinone biosynthesis C-methylase UbiE
VSTPAELWGRGDYGRVAARLQPAAEALVSAAGIKRGQRVLDVAAGSGNVSALAAAAGATVVATDIAPGMVELGKERTAGLDVTWSLADAQDLPFADGNFDAALSVFGAMFAPDQPTVARELLRVVKPGGVAAMTAWIAEGPQADASAHLLATVNAPGMQHDWGDPTVAKQLFEAAGARHVITERRTLDWGFESIDAWMDLMENGPGPIVAAREDMGPDAWAAVRTRFREIMQEGTGAGDGPFALDNPYLLILARP